MAVRKLVVGLGNPGPGYDGTRHNLGARVLAAVAQRRGAAFHRDRQALAMTAAVDGAAGPVLLVLPQTFMNCSGEAVRPLARYHQVETENILLVVDDIRLDFGTVRLRREGSDGGHNGLKSVTSQLGTGGYPRLRIGVGAPPAGADQSLYVLSAFTARERADLDAVIGAAADCCGLWMDGEADRAMAVYNKRKEKENP